jgi:hypothetical protein
LSTVPPPGAGSSDQPLDGDLTPDVAPEDVIPEAARKRLHAAAWTSNLSVADFATCEELGIEPLGFVQGYAVMQWGWYSPYGYSVNSGSYGGPTRPGQYAEQWRCPHGFAGADHRYFGMNMEQVWIEDAWSRGWSLAFGRMLDEAEELGAHGVVGVHDDMRTLAGGGVEEFSIHGTAVTVAGAPRPSPPFTTFLAGQRLAKLVEAGYAPVSVVASMASVLMYANCITLYRLTGRSGWGGVAGVQPIDQVSRAQQAVRSLARQGVRRQLGPDVLHGADLSVFERESGEGNIAIQCMMRGTRVHRFKEFDPLPAPTPVVTLS